MEIRRQGILRTAPRGSVLTMVRDGGRVGMLVSMVCASVACGDLVGNAALPPGTQSPNTYNTPAGALGVYQSAKLFGRSFLFASGAITDELVYASLGTSSISIGAIGDPVDERLLPEDATSNASNNVNRTSYGELQQTRALTREAIGLLQAYAPEISPALRGEMYALQGYAEVMLAELYCSGVPLSTLDFQRDFTYAPSSTATEVYQHAIVLFDSALALSNDSVSITWLASVGKGRALLNLGQYLQAQQAIATVPDTFRYQIPFGWNIYADLLAFEGFTVANQEGFNGLPFIASNDPRVAVTGAGTNTFGVSLFTPTKYGPAFTLMSLVLASGVEARLIQAEAALQADPDNPSWLTIVNTLRTTCTTTVGCLTPAPAGTGGVGGLSPLSDPGSVAGNDSARVTMLFGERAYWLFLTGHRQGDLRRLVRNYGRLQNMVYPTGLYYGGRGTYGGDVTLPIPNDERANPLFRGCLDRRA